MIQARTKPQRGVSLIEALVALAVMSIGMLGLVSLQTSLRGSSDVAKQRSEAVRLAQQEIERWRAFTVLDTTAGRTAYADLAEGTSSEAVTGTNATYTQEKVVADLAAPQRGKSLTVNMSWTDRNNETQTVRLSTAVAGIAPELAATMTVPVSSQALQGPAGGQLAIPPMVKQLGNGRSGFIPPNAGPGVVWIFNNTTGLISLCTTTAASTNALVFDNDPTTTDNVSCGNAPDHAILVSGFVRYALGTTQPTTVEAANPPSLPSAPPASSSVVVVANYGSLQSVDCNVDHVISAPYYTAYFCAVPVSASATPAWTGYLSFKPTWAFANNAIAASLISVTTMRACRYHSAASYTLQSAPLANQNFLLILAGNGTTAFTCPAPPPDPLPNPPPLFTMPHQPGP